MKTFVITGATGSIGKAAATALAKNGHKLILVGRNRNKLDETIREIKTATGAKELEPVIADLSDLSSVKKAAAEIKEKYPKLDGLINVAAVYRGTRELTKDKLEAMFGINHMSVFVLTNELLSAVNASPGGRILTVSAPSSTALDFNNLQGEKKFSAFNAFGASKAANLLHTFALSNRMNGIGTAAMAFHPGLVKSDLIREMPGPLRFLLNLISKKPEKAGQAIAQLMTGNQFKEMNGKFFDSNFKELKAPGNTGDHEIQEKLWKASEELVK